MRHHRARSAGQEKSHTVAAQGQTDAARPSACPAGWQGVYTVQNTDNAEAFRQDSVWTKVVNALFGDSRNFGLSSLFAIDCAAVRSAVPIGLAVSWRAECKHWRPNSGLGIRRQPPLPRLLRGDEAPLPFHTHPSTPILKATRHQRRDSIPCADSHSTWYGNWGQGRTTLTPQSRGQWHSPDHVLNWGESL